MKQIISIITSLLLLSSVMEAKKVPQETALQTATRFLRNSGTTLRSLSAENLKMVSAAKPAATDDTYYYVYSAESSGGFVIISGDDRAYPVLGYSTVETFDPDNLPPSLADWLQHYRDQLEYLLETDPDLPANPAWQTAGARDSGSGQAVELQTAQWNQHEPYNLYCPLLREGQHTVTGCVATAMAIVLKYHADNGYRVTGTGMHEYEAYGINHRAYFGTYDWDNMPLTTEEYVTDRQRIAVAELMYHCGVSIESYYGSSTGSHNFLTSIALSDYFGFDKRLAYIEKEQYSDYEWKSMIKQDIDAGRPILYSGTDSEGGHAFVLDGYNDQGEYKFNWGWGGMYNTAWFTLDALDPNRYSFTDNQAMVTGVRKAESDNISNICFWGFVRGNLNITSGRVNFTGWFINRSYYDFNGSIGVALTDASGNVKSVIDSKAVNLVGTTSWQDIEYITITYGDTILRFSSPFDYVSLSPGDMIRMVSSSDGGQSWQLIYGDPGMQVDYAVGNAAVAGASSPEISVYVSGGSSLTVNSPFAETVRIFDLSGRKVFEGVKEAGLWQFGNCNLPRGVLIVNGNGWSKKIYK